MDDITYRPGGTRLVAYAAAVSLVVMTLVIGYALPDSITFKPVEIATLILTLAGFIAILHGMGRSMVSVRTDRVIVVNGYRRHDLAWTDLKGVSYADDAPWPTIVTTDDERVMLFAIQSSSGRGAARDAVMQIARRIGAESRDNTTSSDSGE